MTLNAPASTYNAGGAAITLPMRKLIELSQNPFIRSSAVVFTGSALVNILNYAFNLVAGRMLSPAEYGETIAITTLALIAGVPALTLTTIVAKYTASYQARNQPNAVRGLFRQATKLSLALGGTLAVLLWACLPFLAGYLKMEKVPLAVFGTIFPLLLLAASGRGTLQGMQEFRSYTTSAVVEAVLKLAFAVALVAVGLAVSGVVAAMTLGLLASFLFSVSRLKAKLHRSTQTIAPAPGPAKSLWSRLPPYSGMIFLATLLLSVFANVDVIMAKHYLPEEQAGLYSALAIIGRIITYGSFAIITVMFPMASSTHAQQKSTVRLMLGTWGMTVAASAAVLLLLVLAPEFMVRTLLGPKYLPITPYLAPFGLAMALTALTKVPIYYSMAVHKTAFLYPFAAMTVLQVALIARYHQDIGQITAVLLWTSLALLALLLLQQVPALFIKANKPAQAL